MHQYKTIESFKFFSTNQKTRVKKILIKGKCNLP